MPINPFLFFTQKTAYEMRISDWSSDVCSSDLQPGGIERGLDRPQRMEPRGRAEPLEFGELHLADPVFGRDRSPRRDHQIVDESRDRGRVVGVPAACRGARGRAHREMDIAVAELEIGGRRVGKEGGRKGSTRWSTDH